VNHCEVFRVLSGREIIEGAGVRVRRVLGIPELQYHDPFLLLDEFKSSESQDYAGGFPEHPHRGFETVTYMLNGAMRHKDHAGNQGVLGPGCVQWMTAGRGIIHSEMPIQKSGLMWGFQLWINLPASEKMKEPMYQDISTEKIPALVLETGAHIRLIAGSIFGAVGPVTGISTAPLYLDVNVSEESECIIPIPFGHNVLAYVFEGEGRVGTKSLRLGQLAVLSNGYSVVIKTECVPMRLLVIAAMPLNEPMVRCGPFVMNSNMEIREAFEQIKLGTFLE